MRTFSVGGCKVVVDDGNGNTKYCMTTCRHWKDHQGECDCRKHKPEEYHASAKYHASEIKQVEVPPLPPAAAAVARGLYVRGLWESRGPNACPSDCQIIVDFIDPSGKGGKGTTPQYCGEPCDHHLGHKCWCACKNHKQPAKPDVNWDSMPKTPLPDEVDDDDGHWEIGKEMIQVQQVMVTRIFLCLGTKTKEDGTTRLTTQFQIRHQHHHAQQQ